jgi:hypothetical protein
LIVENFQAATFQARQPSAGMPVPAKHFEYWNPLWAPFPSILFKYLPANEKTRHNRPGFKEA